MDELALRVSERRARAEALDTQIAAKESEYALLKQRSAAAEQALAARRAELADAETALAQTQSDAELAAQQREEREAILGSQLAET